MKYVLLDQNDEVVGYSDFPIENYTHTETLRDGTVQVKQIRCESGGTQPNA